MAKKFRNDLQTQKTTFKNVKTRKIKKSLQF